MQEWEVGDARVRRLPEFEFVFAGGKADTIIPQATPEALAAISWLSPQFVTPDGMLYGSIHTLLVDTPSARIVVDTCVGNAKRRAIPAYNMLDGPFMKNFERTGWTPESVTHVICTHLHFDHVGWNTTLVDGEWVPTFPNAQYVFTRPEFEYYTTATNEAIATVIADSVAPLVDAGLVALVEMDSEILPGVRLRPAPGHSPGHVNVLMDFAGERAVITGDVMHHPCQVAHPEWSSTLDGDTDLARTTRAAFLDEFADAPVLVIGTHFASPSAGRIVRAGESFMLERP